MKSQKHIGLNDNNAIQIRVITRKFNKLIDQHNEVVDELREIKKNLRTNAHFKRHNK